MRSKSSRRKSARSGTEECPICFEIKALVEHHFSGRYVPDWDKPWNKAYICPSCHDEVHSGKIVIEGWVSSTGGKILAWHYATEKAYYLDDSVAPLYNQKS